MTQTAPPASQRRRHITLVAVVALVLGVVVAWAVLIAAPSARAGIRTEPRWFRCDGREIPYTVVNADDESSDPFAAFDVPLKDYDICQMQFTIINDGEHTVHIDSYTFPALGPGQTSGFPFELSENGGSFPSTDDSAVRIEADEDLGPGESFDELVDLRPRDSVHIDEGMTWLLGLPEIRVSYLGVPGTVPGSIGLAVRWSD